VTTRPLHLPGGEVVEGLVLDFEGGRVVDFSAERGAEALGHVLDAEEGARRLGEFALVGSDSPIAASGVVFRHSYLDENAAAHVALGKAYVEALEGGEGMTPEELDAVGCNRSAVHLDVAFGSAAVDVTAIGAAEVVVLRGGLWNEALDGPDA
jgi:aminopeptidase